MSGADLALAEVEPHRRAGIALDAINSQRRAWDRRRPRGVSLRDVLLAVQFDLVLVHLVACKCRDSGALDDDEFSDLTLSIRSIEILLTEATREVAR
jgi:hypothetical protein